MPSLDQAQLSALADGVLDIARQVAALGEDLDGGVSSEAANSLFEAERSLRMAERAIERARRSLTS